MNSSCSPTEHSTLPAVHIWQNSPGILLPVISCNMKLWPCDSSRGSSSASENYTRKNPLKMYFWQTFSRHNILFDSVEPCLIFCTLEQTLNEGFVLQLNKNAASLFKSGLEALPLLSVYCKGEKRNYLTTWSIKGRVHPALGSSLGLIHTIHIKRYSQTSLVQGTYRWWCNHFVQDWFLKQEVQNSRDKELFYWNHSPNATR